MGAIHCDRTKASEKADHVSDEYGFRSQLDSKRPVGRNLNIAALPVCSTNSPAERHLAVRAVASFAIDAEDCAALLDMLGLNASEGTSISGAEASEG